MPQPHLFSLIDKAVYDYNLIERGDRILLGASGGKDSTALLEYFAHRLRRPSAGFSVAALHVQSEFGGALPERIASLIAQWRIPLVVVKVDVQGRLKPGRKMSCYWCSTQRRTELNNYAMANGFNKIALGHHLDDILETLLMNAVEKGEFSTMVPRLAYKKYPVTIVRPLCYAPVEEIAAHAAEAGYFGWTCTCGFQDNSARKNARRRLELLTDGKIDNKLRLFKALKNVNCDYLP